MALTNDERARAYQDAFDGFVQERGLDIDDRTWSDADRSAWADITATLRAEGVLL